MRINLLIALPALVAAACTPVDLGYGEEVRWNLAQQVIDPDPQYDRDLVEGGSGERSAKAIDRYNKGDVKKPVREATTTPTSGPR